MSDRNKRIDSKVIYGVFDVKVRHNTRYNVLAEVIQALVASTQRKPSGVMTGLLQGEAS